jgi:hypothetical protein
MTEPVVPAGIAASTRVGLQTTRFLTPDPPADLFYQFPQDMIINLM